MQRIVRNLLIVSALVLSQSIQAQAVLSTVFVDRCSGEVKVFTVPMNGQTTIAFYNRARTFTSQQFQNGELQSWLEETYLWWASLNPCSTTATELATTQQTTQQATQAATDAVAASSNIEVNVPSTTPQQPPTAPVETPQTTAPDTSTANAPVSSESPPSDGGVAGSSGDNAGPSGGSETSSTETQSSSDQSDTPSTEASESTEQPSESTSTEETTTEDSSSSESTEDSTQEGSESESEESGGDSGDGEAESESEESESVEEESSEESTEEESTEEESSEEESTEESSEEESEESTSKKKKKKKKRALSAPVLAANIMSMQSPLGDFSTAANFGLSQTSLRGDKTYGLNAMVYSNLQQFIINASFSQVHINKEGRVSRVYSGSIGGSKMFSTVSGMTNHSLVFLGKKGSVVGASLAANLTSVELDIRQGLIYYDDQILGGSFTAFYTKPFNLDRWTVSPMLAASAPFVQYSLFGDDGLTFNKDLLFISGGSFSYQLTKRFVANLGANAITSTIEDFPLIWSFTIGSRFIF